MKEEELIKKIWKGCLDSVINNCKIFMLKMNLRRKLVQEVKLL